MSRLLVFLVSAAFSVLSVTAQEVVSDPYEYNAGVFSSPDLMLQGKVAGLKVGAVDGNVAGYLNINIRGLNSMFSTSNPLWIVDGVALSDCANQVQDAFDRNVYGSYNYTSKSSVLDFLNLYDIESIEVLKNLSQTSRYGSKGANGVIVVTTKRAVSNKPLITWHSNVGYSVGAVLPSHNHDVSVSMLGNRTNFRLSGFYRDIQSNGYDRTGGLRLVYDMHSSDLIWVGFNASATYSKNSLWTAAANYGVPTYGLALSGISLTDKINSVKGWAEDCDDLSDVFRGNGNLYLQVNFLPWLKWRTDLSFDFNNSARYFWYGKNTQFGADFENAAAIDAAALFSYVVQTRLSMERYIMARHKISAELHAQLDGESNRFNNMSGDHLLTDVLRAKGLSLRQSASIPHHLTKEYGTIGADLNIYYSFDKYAGVNASVLVDRFMRYDDSFSIYPSVDAWVDLHELFLRNNDAVSGLSVSCGWGKAGYKRYIPYQLSGRLVGDSVIAQALLEREITVDESSAQNNIANYFDGLNRGVSGEANASLKAAFLSNRISVRLGYYVKHTEELFKIYCFGRQRFQDSYVWCAADKWTLLSEERNFYNRGFEASVTASILNDKAVKWNVAANVATSKSNYKSYLSSSLEEFTPFPTAYGGISTDLSVHGIDINLVFSGAAGFDIYNANSMLADQATTISPDYVESGDYLSLSRASVGYTFNIDKVKWIQNLRVSLSGANLFTITGYSGVNPDVNSFGSTAGMYSGIDYGTLPLRRTIMVGIKAEF